MKRIIWNSFTEPKAIAIVGASDKPGNVGTAVLHNLLIGRFPGRVFAVNSQRETVQGMKAYHSLESLPSPVDLAVIATPASTVPDLIRQCGAAGVPAAVVLSAGFEESGDAGHKLAEELRRAALHSGVRLLGPNCVGIICPHSRVNASFGMNMPEPGTVAFLSQSGALGTAILDWSIKEKIGLSTFVSLGSMVDIGWAEVLDCLADDHHTQSIIVYMESIGNAREFMSAARELALYKPIIVLKAGRHSEGAKAAMSHTGAMAGSDDVLDAALDRCGVLRVKSIAELFYMAEALSKQPRAHGPRLTIVTNAGGPAVLAADALADEAGVMTELSPDTLSALNGILPASWSKGNPIDVLGDADASRYAAALQLAMADPNTDSVLAILTPQAMTDPTAVAKAVASLPKPPGKPLLASWMGGEAVDAGTEILQNASIPVFPYPDTAARIAYHMYRYGETLRNLYETPHALFDDGDPSGRPPGVDLIASAQNANRTVLSEHDAKTFLKEYGIPIVETVVAGTASEATRAAKAMGFPVALKLNSYVITHKNKVGGVRLDLHTPDAVADAFRQIKESTIRAASPAAFQGVTVQRMAPRAGCELIIGSKIDPQFGPVILFGSGGSFAEAMDDFAVALPPLNTTLAGRLMRKTRAYRLIAQIGKKAPEVLDQLERLIVTMSRLVIDHPVVTEVEINPLLVTEHGLVALDARVGLKPKGVLADVLPAIEPYPLRLTKPWTTKQDKQVLIRPIRPEDEPAIVRFHGRLSDTSLYHRYFSIPAIHQRVAHDRLVKLCHIDYRRQMALVVEYVNPQTGENEIAAVGRLIRQRRSNDAEFALLVSDLWQGQGIGSELLRCLIAHARETHIDRVTADILPDNEAMQHICRSQGFELTRNLEACVVEASLTVEAAAVSTAAS